VAPLRILVFDLDDTLYLERDYVKSGFDAIAQFTEAQADLPSGEVQRFLENAQTRNKGRVFDSLLEHYPDLTNHMSVMDLIEIYRSHEPTIKFLPGVVSLLEHAKRAEHPLALISDGPILSQQKKSKALGLETHFAHIRFTDIWGPGGWKPNPRAFHEIEDRFECSGEAMVYIGDNPTKDFIAPKALKWATVRLRLPGQLHESEEPNSPAHAPDQNANGIDELSVILKL
jgi:putative hydrolase of the HAD superfamily